MRRRRARREATHHAPYRAPLRLRRWFVLALSGLFLVGAVGVGVFAHFKPEHTYAPNVAAELFGLFVAVIVVERLLAWERERRAIPLTRSARRRLRSPMGRLTGLLARMVAAASAPGAALPASATELVDAWQVAILDLDFRAPAGQWQGRNLVWHEYAATVLAGIERDFRDVLLIFGEVLPPRVVEAVDETFDTYAIAALRNPDAYTMYGSAGRSDFPGSAEVIAEAARPLLALYDAYERYRGAPLPTSDLAIPVEYQGVARKQRPAGPSL